MPAKKCEDCGCYAKLTPFGEDDVMLCDPCWRSAFHHKHYKGPKRECGHYTCRICYEEE